MKRITLMAALAAFAFTTVAAQETVIVRKNKDSKEKVTVVVDGDNITVNGKDIKDYKGDDVQVVRGFKSASGLNSVRAITAPGARMADLAEIRAINGEHFTYAFGGNKAMLGVNTEKVDNGVRITDVTKESAAAKAGLQKDDVITKVGDRKIEDADDLYAAVGKHKPEDKVDITYLRGGKENKVTATLGKSSSNAVWAETLAPSISYNKIGGYGTTFLRRPRLGIQIQDTEDNSGVKVLDVNEETPAAKSGLKDGDIIYEINGKAVKSLDEIREETKDLKEGDTLKIKYKRGSSSESTEIKFPKRLNKASL